MVPHSWILKCLEMVGAAKNMISIISNSMVNWKTVLTSGGMAHVTLDPSTTKNDLKLYEASKDQLDSLVQVVRIFSQDIKMSFGLDKCAVLEMRRERQVGSSGIELPDHQHIGELVGETGRRKPYMARLSNKYQMKLERSLADGSGMDS